MQPVQWALSSVVRRVGPEGIEPRHGSEVGTGEHVGRPSWDPVVEVTADDVLPVREES